MDQLVQERKRHLQLYPDCDWEHVFTESHQDMMKKAPNILESAAVTKAECMIILVLQNPASKKYKGRLSDFTAGIASQCQKDWALVLNQDLVVMVKAALLGSAVPAAVSAKPTEAAASAGSAAASSAAGESAKQERK